MPLIVSVGREFEYLEWFAAVPQYAGRRTIDLGAAAAAFLVMESSGISEASQHEAMLDATCCLPVLSQPCYGADRSRNK